jgi:hypothetical protein
MTEEPPRPPGEVPHAIAVTEEAFSVAQCACAHLRAPLLFIAHSAGALTQYARANGRVQLELNKRLLLLVSYQ